MKAQSFNGVLFAKFSSAYDRDIVIATLRSANIKHDQHQIWATQDLPIPTRARKMFLLGLRWQLGEWGFLKREIEIDEHYTKMTIAGKTVVQVTSSNGEFLVEWANGWATWDEIQSCAQLQQIMDRAKVVMKKQGKGTGKSKDMGATPSHQGQLCPSQVSLNRSAHMHFPTFVAGKPGDNPLHDNTVCRHHEREAETFQATNDSFHVHAKNARIENKWAEILGELSMEQWDVVLFSETRCAAGMLSLNGQQLSLRVMYIDLLCGTGLYRIVVGYAPHAGYPKVDLD